MTLLPPDVKLHTAVLIIADFLVSYKHFCGERKTSAGISAEVS